MPSKNTEVGQIKICRRFLKNNVKSQHCIEHLSSEYSQLLNIMKRTVDFGESDSVLLIGPHGCGKTILINEAVQELKDSCKNKDFIIISLNGLIHVDDNLALKDITRQLNIALDDSEKFSGSFSDNLQHLLKSLRDSEDKIVNPLLFILEEFHLFCSHRNQTLLYNLFDSVQSSNGICVIGATTRIDVTEMLEKRVKSRFSHRQLLLLYHPTAEQRISLFKKLLTLPQNSDDLSLEPSFIKCWNKHVAGLSSNDSVIRTLRRQLELDTNEAKFRIFLFALVSQLNDEHNLLTADDVVSIHNSQTKDDKVLLLQGLSVLEICLIIAMSHQNEIFDGEPFNFEMIISRYLKFAKQNYAVQIMQRPVILKAFERIKNLELISSVGITAKNIQKEFQLYNFLLTKDQVTAAISSYSGIPTDVAQWSTSSLI